MDREVYSRQCQQGVFGRPTCLANRHAGMSHTTEFTCKYCCKDTTIEGLADIPVCPACRASLASRAHGVSAGCSDACIESRSTKRSPRRSAGLPTSHQR
jgi:hypothetical protein